VRCDECLSAWRGEERGQWLVLRCMCLGGGWGPGTGRLFIGVVWRPGMQGTLEELGKRGSTVNSQEMRNRFRVPAKTARIEVPADRVKERVPKGKKEGKKEGS